MFCRECGKEVVNQNVMACTHCGVNPRNGKSFCQHCGVKTKDKQIMCTKCGGSLAYTFGSTQNIDSGMIKAVLVTVLCCLPLGIVAIIKSSEVSGKLAVGDIAGAKASAEESHSWSNWGILLTIIFVILYFFLLLSLGSI